MNAGKSTALLQSSYNYQERGMRTLVFTAEVDHRFGVGKVSSRIGLSSQAQLYNSATQLYAMINQEHQQQPVHCVLVDESQFLTKEQVEELCEVVDQLDIPVLCYGLRTDFLGELFVGSHHLLAWADKLVELKTICHCGRKANMVLRLGEDGKAMHYGGASGDWGVTKAMFRYAASTTRKRSRFQSDIVPEAPQKACAAFF
ncbi:Thymidine kinase [Serratia fonticola]|uniref:Thymidine kinase n=1 Tax=Serratia fonticola TaxID=47917 RepID=A0A4V6KRT4_SERFO|nr:Thymidine kinase [Serratia fonticola]